MSGEAEGAACSQEPYQVHEKGLMCREPETYDCRRNCTLAERSTRSLAWLDDQTARRTVEALRKESLKYDGLK